MRVKFAVEEKFAVVEGRKVLGHCFQSEKDATIIVDNILMSNAPWLEQYDEEMRRALMVTPIHELIHKFCREYDEELVEDVAWDIANLTCGHATRIWG